MVARRLLPILAVLIVASLTYFLVRSPVPKEVIQPINTPGSSNLPLNSNPSPVQPKENMNAVVLKKDTEAPEVTLLTPKNGETVKGVIRVEARASDNIGVTKIEFFAGSNGKLVGSVDKVPYRIDWDTAPFYNGGYNIPIYAMAYDAAGNVGSSKPAVAVYVKSSKDVTPPTISIITPTNDQKVSGTVDVVAEATDDEGVVKVEFFASSKGTLIGTAEKAPFKISWDTGPFVNMGINMPLYAKAYDAAGNVGHSSPAIAVYVVPN